MLIVGGEEDQMNEVLHINETDIDRYINITHWINKDGLFENIIGYKILDPEITNNFLKEYKECQKDLLNKRSRAEDLIAVLEKEVEFVGGIGLSNVIREDTIEFLDLMKSCNIKIGIASGDSFKNVMAAAVRAKIIEYDSNYICIKREEDISKLKIEINKILSDLALKYSEIFNSPEKNDQNSLLGLKKNLVISNSIFNIIQENEEIYNNFIFLLHFSKNLICYDMSPFNKGYLVNILRSANAQGPQVIAAVGDGFNDLEMIKNANVGIQLLNQNLKTQHYFGKIITNSLRPITDIFRKEGYHFSLNLLYFINYNSFYITFSILSAYILNYTLKDIEVFTIYEIPQLLLIQNIFNIFFIYNPIAQFALPNQLFKTFPIIYIMQARLKQQMIQKILYFIIIGAINSIIFCISIIFFIEIKTIFISDLTIMLMISNAIVTKFTYIAFHPFPDKRLIIYSILHIICEIGISFGIDASSKMRWEDFLRSSNFRVVKNVFIIIPLLCIISFICGINMFLSYYLSFNSSYSFIKSKIKLLIKKKTSILTKRLNFEANIYKILHKSYKKITQIHPSLYSFINLKGAIANKKLFTLLLKFTDKNLENLFKIHNDDVSVASHIYYFFMIILTLLLFLDSEKDKEKYPRICFCFAAFVGLKFMPKKLLSHTNYFYCILFLSFIFRLLILLNNDLLQLRLTIFLSIIIFGDYYIASTYTKVIITVIELIVYITKFILFYNKIHISLLEKFHFSVENEFCAINNIYLIMSALIILVIYKVQGISRSFELEKLSRLNFLAKLSTSNDLFEGKDILSMLMPKFVLDRITNYQLAERSFSDETGYVSIIFCDICDFDSIIHEMGSEIVKLLDEIFRNFDELCRKYGIQKIETVGKTYMAVSGLKFFENSLPKSLQMLNPTNRAFKLAQEMQLYMSTVTVNNNKVIKIKIGIHYGECVFGIIGYHKPQFSLIGDTVNTTSRVCTTGKSGGIMLSHQAWIQLHPNINAFEIVPTEMKGKGIVNVYHYVNKKDMRKTSITKKNINKIETRKKFTRAASSVLGTIKLKKAAIQKKLTLVKIESVSSVEPVSPLLHNLEPSQTIQPVSENEETDIQFDKPDDTEIEQLKPIGVFLKFPKAQKKLAKVFYKEMQQKMFTKLKRTGFVLYGGIMILTFLKLMYIASISYYWIIFGVKIFITIASITFVIVSGKKQIGTIRKNIMFKLFGFIFITLWASSYGISSVYWRFQNFTTDAIFSVYFTIEIQEFGLLFLLLSELMQQKKILYFNFNFFPLIYCSYFVFVRIIKIKYYLLGTIWAFIVFGFIGFFFSPEQIWLDALFLVFIAIIHGGSNYRIFKFEIVKFNDNISKKKAVAETNAFVSRLLPTHIQKNIMEGKEISCEQFENVTLLFADIVGFTAYSAGRKPRDVVEMLSKLFTRFDKECDRLNLYKVYTIGDCYVVMSFVNKASRKQPRFEALDMVKMGFSMIKIIHTIQKEIDYNDLHMRIGIHTGNIMGGVIGTDIVRFDIYGENVLIANKMESNGLPDSINLSEATKNFLENDNFDFQFNQEIELKSIGKTINSYFVMEGNDQIKVIITI